MESGGTTGHSRTYSETAVTEATTAPKPKLGGGGLSLGKAKKQDHASRVLKESGLAAAAAAVSAPAQAASAPADDHPVSIKIEEKISVNLNRDGGVSAVDVSGAMTITIVDGAHASVRVHLAPSNDEFAFKTHPNINKVLHSSDNVLAIKDNRPFPVNAPTSILRWRAQALGKTKVPLTINCWPSSSGASVEFELENPALRLTNVQIALPLAGAFPDVSSISCGSFQHDSATSTLHWLIPAIDSANSSGSMDVQLSAEVGEEAFFPAAVAFVCDQSLARVSVVTVADSETHAAVPFGCHASIVTDVYTVE